MMDTRCPTCFGELTSGQCCSRCSAHGQPRSSPLALASGTLLAGQYRVGQVLGQPGGFGITYLAWDEQLETRIAKGDRSRSLSVILKPGYAPYEQYASSGRPGAWTDV